MRYFLDIEGFEGHEIAVVPSGVIRPSHVLFDGKPAKKGPARREFVIPRNDGRKVRVRLRHVFIDPVPKVEIDGETYLLDEPLNPLVFVWCLLPILLVFFGGFIGGGIGGFAAGFNIHVYRRNWSGAEKFLATLLISIGAAGVYFGIIFLIALFIAGDI